MKPVRKTVLVGALTVLGLSFSVQTNAADINQWPGWMREKALGVTRESPAVPDNNVRAMPCSECKSVTVVAKRDLVAGKPGHGFKEVATSIHQCESCLDTVTRKPGTKEVAWAHTCSAPDESPLCCATVRTSARGS